MAPATLTGVSPASGPTAGGTPVTINGSSFTTASGVTFGIQAAASFTVNNDGSITAVAPAQSPDYYDIVITNAGGTSLVVPSDRFTYVAAAGLQGSVSTSKAGANLTTLGTSDGPTGARMGCQATITS